MANPTTAKPSAVFNAWTNTGFGALLRCQWMGTATDYRDPIGNVLWEPHVPRIGGCGMAYPPENVAEWTAGDVTNDYCLKCVPGSMAMRAPGRGWSDAVTVSIRSMGAVFEPWIQPGTANRTCPVATNGLDNTIGYGIASQVNASTGAILLGSHVGGTFNSSGITLAIDKKYVVILTYTSGTGRAWQVYNWTDQVWVTTAGTPTTSTDSSTPSVSTLPDFVLNACTSYDSISVGEFVGRIYTAFLYDGDLRASTSGTISGYVDAIVADPFNAVRGAIATGAGPLTAAGIVGLKNSPTTQTGIASRPTGGASTAYQFRWHRDTTPSFAESSATLITAYSSSPFFSDTTRKRGVLYHYKCEMTDGTSTVVSTTATTNSTQILSTPRRTEMLMGILGDSRVTTSSYIVGFYNMMFDLGCAPGFINGGLSSSQLKSATAGFSWQTLLSDDPNGQASVTLLPKLLARMAKVGCTLLYIEASINDMATADSQATVAANLAVITNYVIAQGISVILGKPFARTDTEQTLADLHVWWAYLDTLDNGTTIRVLPTFGKVVAYYAQDAEMRDKIHKNHAGSDGGQTALDFMRRLDPGAFGLGAPVAALGLSNLLGMRSN